MTSIGDVIFIARGAPHVNDYFRIMVQECELRLAEPLHVVTSIVFKTAVFACILNYDIADARSARGTDSQNVS